jgi:hypothetical protein
MLQLLMKIQFLGVKTDTDVSEELLGRAVQGGPFPLIGRDGAAHPL